mmetsp:Transcript_782/g.1226  ORF Transcript_782/g.1226 Transcript_782/m.1226 type:complete len:541 (-) Transcript_782:402-2024(-)
MAVMTTTSSSENGASKLVSVTETNMNNSKPLSDTINLKPDPKPEDYFIPEEKGVATSSDQPDFDAIRDQIMSNCSADRLVTSAADDEDDHLAIASCLALTYESTKECVFYSNAKKYLNEGNFESALNSVEKGIKTILSLLPSADELHPCLAPLYYMYGTTLLYSIEESSDNPESSVMAQQGVEDETAGDLQISWENLEMARSILSSITTSSSGDKILLKERQNDLAQVYMRLGDLSRHNGHYSDAINDYDKCGTLRKSVLGLWNRKVADTEYCLGMTCMLLAAEGEKNLQPIAEEQTAVKSSDATPENENKVILSIDEINEYRNKSISHYLECGRVMGGIISSLSGQDPSDIDYNFNKERSVDINVGSSMLMKENASVDASKKLNMIRSHVSKMEASDHSDSDLVCDMKEILDEIQEAIDTADDDREGLRDVNAMKKKAEADIIASDKLKKSEKTSVMAANDWDKQNESKGEITTIGFSSVLPKSCTSNLTGGNTAFVGNSVSSAIATKIAAPMMVVKKKKKLDGIEASRDNVKKLKTSN